MLIILFLITKTYSQCCIKFNGEDCIECPINTRLYRGNCLFPRKNCREYRGFECSLCNDGYKLANNTCITVCNIFILFLEYAKPTTPTSGFIKLTAAQINTTLVQNMIKSI